MFRADELPVALAGGTYRLHRLIGSGGMASVYHAEVDLDRFDFALVIAHSEKQKGDTRDLREERREQRYRKWKKRPRPELEEICRNHELPFPAAGIAAVKVLQSGIKAQERFEAEWISMLAIGHPNLVSVYGGGVDEATGLHFYAMELLPDILTRKQLKALSLHDKLLVVRQAAAGLACLHEKGIIHRDIKPDNIVCVYTPEGLLAKVCDLGIAKDTTRTVELTITEQVMGTPYYMAPEQAEGAKHVTAASDVYSLGASLYKMVSGVAPYDGQSLFEVMGKLARGEPPTPIRRVTEGKVPEMLELLIERMMAFRPDRRPGRMVQVLGAIDRYLESADSELQGARTIMDLSSAKKIQTAQRRDFEQLLAAPHAGIAAPGGPVSKLRVGLLVLLILCGFTGGFLAGPGRKYIRRYLERKQPPEPVLVVSGDRPPVAPKQKQPDPAEPRQLFRERLSRAETESQRQAGLGHYDEALAALDGLDAEAARYSLQPRLQAARQAVRLLFEQRLSRAEDESRRRTGREQYDEALAALAGLDPGAARFALALRLKTARDRVATARTSRLDALRAQLSAARKLAEQDSHGEALALLDKLAASAARLGLGGDMDGLRNDLVAARDRRAEAIEQQLKLAVTLYEDDRKTAPVLLDALARVHPAHPRLSHWREELRKKARKFKLQATAPGNSKLSACLIVFDEQANQSGLADVRIQTARSTRLELALSGLPKGKWDLFLFIRPEKAGTLEILHGGRSMRLHTIKRSGSVVPYDCPLVHAGGDLVLELRISAGADLILSGLQLEIQN